MDAIEQNRSSIEQDETRALRARLGLWARFHTILNARIEYVGKYRSCMGSKLRTLWKQTVGSRRMRVVYTWHYCASRTARLWHLWTRVVRRRHPAADYGTGACTINRPLITMHD